MPTPNDYRTCATEGLTATEAAARLGVCRETVRTHAHKLHIKFLRYPKRRVNRRSCTPTHCVHFDQCKSAVASGQPALCETSIHIEGQPEHLLWSRNGGQQAITDCY